jgi:hypothetical protein
MSGLEDYGIDLRTLREMHERWQQGATKSALEIEYLGKVESHGKLFSSLVRRYLGIETEKRSASALEIDRLRRLLHKHGIDPDDDS